MKRNLLKTMLVGIGLLAGMGSVFAEDTYTKLYSRTTTYGAENIWTESDITDWGGNSNLQLSVPTAEGSSGEYYGLWFNPTKPGDAYSAKKSFDVTNDAKVKYEINWYFGNSTGRTSNYEYLQIGDNIRFSWNSSYVVYLTTDGTSSTTGTNVLSGKGSYTKKVVVIFNTASKSVESITFDGTDYTGKMPSSLDDDNFNSVSFGFVRGGSTSNWAYPNGIKSITVSQCEQVVTKASYTINYTNDGATVYTETGSLPVGNPVTAATTVDSEDGTHYLITADSAPEFTISATENVFEVPVRKPYTGTLKLTTVVGETSSESSETFTEQDDKTFTWSYSYPMYAKSGDVYYKADETSSYGESGSFTTDGETVEKTVKYSTADETVAYYVEFEDVSSYDITKDDFTLSNGGAAAAPGGTGLSLGTFSKGVYKVTANVANDANKRSYCLHDASADKTESLYSTTGGTTGVQETSITLANDVELLVTGFTNGNGAYNQSARIDYVLVQKTGDVEAVEVSSAKFATYCSANALDFTNSTIKAYTATVSNGVATLTQIDQVPENTGVMLYSAAGEATEAIPVIASATAPTSNAFVGVTEETTVYSTDGTKTNYVLGSKDGAVSFYKAASTTNGGTKVGANKAYLSTESSTSTDAKQITIVFDGETTGINNVKAASTKTNTVYNLNGQRVAQPTKGLYIVNGKKVILK